MLTQFGREAVNALDNTLLGLEEQKRLGLLGPQEHANLSARMLFLKADVLRGMGLLGEAQIFADQAISLFADRDLWEGR